MMGDELADFAGRGPQAVHHSEPVEHALAGVVYDRLLLTAHLRAES